MKCLNFDFTHVVREFWFVNFFLWLLIIVFRDFKSHISLMNVVDTIFYDHNYFLRFRLHVSNFFFERFCCNYTNDERFDSYLFSRIEKFEQFENFFDSFSFVVSKYQVQRKSSSRMLIMKKNIEHQSIIVDWFSMFFFIVIVTVKKKNLHVKRTFFFCDLIRRNLIFFHHI